MMKWIMLSILLFGMLIASFSLIILGAIQDESGSQKVIEQLSVAKNTQTHQILNPSDIPSLLDLGILLILIVMVFLLFYAVIQRLAREFRRTENE